MYGISFVGWSYHLTDDEMVLSIISTYADPSDHLRLSIYQLLVKNAMNILFLQLSVYISMSSARACQILGVR